MVFNGVYIAKNFAKTGTNDYVQNFRETTSRLW